MQHRQPLSRRLGNYFVDCDARAAKAAGRSANPCVLAARDFVQQYRSSHAAELEATGGMVVPPSPEDTAKAVHKLMTTTLPELPEGNR